MVQHDVEALAPADKGVLERHVPVVHERGRCGHAGPVQVGDLDPRLVEVGGEVLQQCEALGEVWEVGGGGEERPVIPRGKVLRRRLDQRDIGPDLPEDTNRS